ncbi:MAG: helix-turn-helix domain-containing protein [Ruminococcus sp.]|uniref:helix-turn-helix domain-containing protein n=1 Tax=Ruminococcus sp. TaxID=41978 RepID=UPI002872AEC9|nr:helix-turn-helix domain-containing protein [Ruminococcus sp.]MBQ3285800.1 helix-turn-helix domain-containing protein [Ruminococcus sp.]
MIASNIRFLRKQENLSQEEFAERFGVSRQSVAKWESGESVPDLMKCREIAEYYDISIDTLVSLSLEGIDMNEKTTDGKYIFGMVKVTEGGRITIPEYALEVFNIHEGDRLMVMGDTARGGIALAKISLGNIFHKK